MVRIIGDVHNKLSALSKLLALPTCPEYILQLGDLGFAYDKLIIPNRVNFKFIPGNHEDYNRVASLPYALGDGGNYSMGDFDFFYVRGGLSIDKAYRTPGFDWFAEEELNAAQRLEVLMSYMESKPTIVCTHEAPADIIPYVAELSDEYLSRKFEVKLPSDTAHFLQRLLNIHRPQTWIFGHYHRSFDQEIDGTRFVCLNELEYLDME